MLIERTLRYLGWRGALDEPMRQLLDSCAQEVRTLRPSFAHARFSLSHDPLRLSEAGIVLPSAQLDRSFRMCDACEVVGITLGAEAERLVRYYALIDMARMSVLDAMLSAWVEECCDESERQIITETRTARLCPGYGDIPLALNEPLGAALSLPRIGLYVKAGGALSPQKSMIGLIGIGDVGQPKSCGSCIRSNDCEYRKRGERCYASD
ncbi:MAG TPA: vitamin B12 dependent methionine synthase [Candidatus Merdibacter merdavium]|uniref:Vitamin B12 dependent methionine synthase n=1 Tax=Candidatus Merdibacter merdavium TaxID=2838692 RepID=A0A9D2NRL6_9FIRM|nr:vitamin B12 dependent methionine synthase [Candidatus Merdibacter merdavium]